MKSRKTNEFWIAFDISGNIFNDRFFYSLKALKTAIVNSTGRSSLEYYKFLKLPVQEIIKRIFNPESTIFKDTDTLILPEPDILYFKRP